MHRFARILIVDATTADSSRLPDALTGAGYHLRIAESGESALSQVAHESPDLILLDALMPGVDGFTICRRLKDTPQCRDTPVIFMSILSDSGEKVRAFAAGAIDYITKPVHPPEVLARVQAHLELRRLRRALEDELTLRIEAEHQLSRALDRAVLLVDHAHRIVFASRLAENLLHRHYPDFRPGHLPANLGQDASPLAVRRFPGQETKDLTFLLLEERTPSPHPSALQSLGLTPREAEVLYWIAQGKANHEIGRILGTALRTVDKHVEHILAKLGVDSRTTAALEAAVRLRA